VASPEVNDYLADIRRSFHTLKGSGRMVGAMAIGEYAWVLESLANNLSDGTVEPNDTVKSVFSNAPNALTQLMGQVKGECVTTDVDIDSLAVLATMCCDPNAAFDESCLDGTDNVDDESIEVVEIPEMVEWVEATDSEGDADASEFVRAAVTRCRCRNR
jgi:chemotaxis protein histidine kinase CheA